MDWVRLFCILERFLATRISVILLVVLHIEALAVASFLPYF